MATLNLKQFIVKHSLDPEDGGLGLAWFHPEKMLFVSRKKIDNDTELNIFSDGATKCGLLDTATTSILLSEDDVFKIG